MDAGLLAGTKAAKVKDPTSAPNVIWRGEAEPPSAVNVGNLFIGNLPDEPAQRAGFYSEHAHVLISAMGDYKAFHGKGGE